MGKTVNVYLELDFTFGEGKTEFSILVYLGFGFAGWCGSTLSIYKRESNEVLESHHRNINVYDRIVSVDTS